MLRYSREDLKKQLTWSDLDTDYLKQIVGLARIEDLAGAGLAKQPSRLGDVTSALMPETVSGRADLNARESLVVCGLELVPTILEMYSAECTFLASTQDGTMVEHGQSLGVLQGPASSLLQAERIILNFLQHLSGIATETAKYVAEREGSETVLLDTRKTLPGYRVLQKYAVACGGGFNHRIGLFDRVMLKDNHLVVAGATAPDRLEATVLTARSTLEDIPIEVEIDRMDQLQPVLDAGADIVMLDNFTTDDMVRAVQIIDGRALSEASGNITISRMKELKNIGLDFISSGAPIHQSTWRDIGLDWQS